MPPMPVPWVLATSPGCTHRISSVGVKPDDRNASTVATMFHSATRSIEVAMSWLMPHTVGANPGGIFPPNGPRQLVLARHANLGPRLAGNLPVAGFGDRPDHRVLRIELGKP